MFPFPFNFFCPAPAQQNVNVNATATTNVQSVINATAQNVITVFQIAPSCGTPTGYAGYGGNCPGYGGYGGYGAVLLPPLVQNATVNSNAQTTVNSQINAGSSNDVSIFQQ